MSERNEPLAALAERALANGEEERALPRLSAWLRNHPNDVTILHWSAMLYRALDQREAAITALRRARRIEPANAGVAHALAHVSLEAGLPAAALFEVATQLAPGNSDIRLGLASSRFAQNEGARGLDELQAMLTANPGWYEGHRQFAQLSALAGRSDHALASVEATLQRFSQSVPLHKLAIDLLLEAERYTDALEAADKAISMSGGQRAFSLAKAMALDELGRSDQAAPIFEALGAAVDSDEAVLHIRHWLRRGEVSRAGKELERCLDPAGSAVLWPYVALVWRLLDDPRARWLDRDGGLVSMIDLPASEIGLPALRTSLRGLHARSGRFLGQSVRGGTQTEGVLLARIDPEIANLRERLRDEVAGYLRKLPPPDGTHPTLRLRRDRSPRFAGSWSVRLQSQGFHVAHQHPQGCISSALYLVVPGTAAVEEGSLELGAAPPGLGVMLEPLVKVRPKAGRLVLFPSWMWHATRPFAAGERMTVAFDIARP